LNLFVLILHTILGYFLDFVKLFWVLPDLWTDLSAQLQLFQRTILSWNPAQLYSNTNLICLDRSSDTWRKKFFLSHCHQQTSLILQQVCIAQLELLHGLEGRTYLQSFKI